MIASERMRIHSSGRVSGERLQSLNRQLGRVIIGKLLLTPNL